MTQVCFTIDTEGDSPLNPDSTYLGIRVVLPSLLKLFAKYNVKATFFVQEDEICQVGTLFSKLWEVLQLQGHEIGHHAHGLVRASRDEKERIITAGLKRLRDLDLNAVSFRGGCFHFDGNILRILETNAVEFDSSVVPGLRESFPDGTLRCDHIRAPDKPYYPSYLDHKSEGQSKVLELPVNRYPKFPANRWGGVLNGGEKDEVLFDYFLEIKNDKLIILDFHLWQGLSSAIRDLAHKKRYGKIKKGFLESLPKITGSDFLTNGAYVNRFNHLLKYISAKNDIIFTTVKEAGDSIKKHWPHGQS
jgi:hypothetical protein